MRLMLRFSIPVEKGNEAAADGSMSKAIQNLVEDVQPEAVFSISTTAREPERSY